MQRDGLVQRVHLVAFDGNVHNLQFKFNRRALETPHCKWGWGVLDRRFAELNKFNPEILSGDMMETFLVAWAAASH